MELVDYNIASVYIKGKDNVLAEASPGKNIRCFKRAMQKPKTQQSVTCKDMLLRYMQMTCIP